MESRKTIIPHEVMIKHLMTPPTHEASNVLTYHTIRDNDNSELEKSFINHLTS